MSVPLAPPSLYHHNPQAYIVVNAVPLKQVLPLAVLFFANSQRTSPRQACSLRISRCSKLFISDAFAGNLRFA